jgi:hypothetical protein
VTVSLRPPIPRDVPLATDKPKPSGLTQSVAKLREADARYSHVRTDVEGSVVHLRGSVQRWEDVLELAQAVSRLAGVERVIVDQITTRKVDALHVP